MPLKSIERGGVWPIELDPNQPRYPTSAPTDSQTATHQVPAGQGALAMCIKDAQKEVGALMLRLGNDKEVIEERHLPPPWEDIGKDTEAACGTLRTGRGELYQHQPPRP